MLMLIAIKKVVLDIVAVTHNSCIPIEVSELNLSIINIEALHDSCYNWLL